MINKDTFEAHDVVTNYFTQTYLHKPEETVLTIFKNRLKNMRMLDVGVGGGRTTYHFARLAKQYVGIDYSEKMIDACKKRFPNASQNISFKPCDVRFMKIFEDNYFDFVLVSNNGLDYMSHEDRLKTLLEIKRVGKKRGFLCFSTHNLQSIKQLLPIQLSLNPLTMSKNILRSFLLRLLNKSFKKLKYKKYALINDGAHQFRLLTYYIRPKDQIKQLSNLGFRNIQVYSLADGKQIVKKSDVYITTDGLYHGLYYLCNF